MPTFTNASTARVAVGFVPSINLVAEAVRRNGDCHHTPLIFESRKRRRRDASEHLLPQECGRLARAAIENGAAIWHQLVEIIEIFEVPSQDHKSEFARLKVDQSIVETFALGACWI